MTGIDIFQDSLSRSNVFPRNLVYSNIYDHVLEAHADRLDNQSERLFCDEEKADVEMWEYKNHATGFVSHRSTSHVDLRNHIVGAHLFAQVDPECRFVFIHAGHSRDKLKITKAMLTTVLTYYQAMAQFVDFVFSFGKQKYTPDFHFSGVYHETRLTSYQPRLALRDLGRSGYDFQLCYNLKSVELSNGQPLFPWSVRILAVYHRFDVITGQTFWTVVKGDDLIQRRIKSATRPGSNLSRELGNPSRTFSLTLDTHLIIFDWCREKWRWYISYLEDLQEATTRRAITTSFDRPTGQPSMDPPIITATASPGKVKRTFTLIGRRVASGIGTLPPPPPQAPSPDPAPPPPDYEPDLKNTEIFSISDLQNLTSWEEKIKELLLVIRSNIKIVTDVKQYYMDLTTSPDFPDEIKSGSMTKLKDFEITVASIVNDLEMQYSRADMLLSTLTNRKGLLNGILDYRNMEASKSFAEKAEASTKEMQNMTEEMKELTQKTKQETVSMRIITLVTLFFLPGTFISTIMSTDILQFSKIEGSNKFEENYSPEALKRYVEITVPLMTVTFVAWYLVYLWVDKRQDVKALKRNYVAKWSSDHKC